MSRQDVPGTPDAEAALLGAMLLSNGAIHDSLRAGLDVGDFYNPHHQTIAEAVVALHNNSDPVDAVTVSGWLTRGSAGSMRSAASST